MQFYFFFLISLNGIFTITLLEEEKCFPDMSRKMKNAVVSIIKKPKQSKTQMKQHYKTEWKRKYKNKIF